MVRWGDKILAQHLANLEARRGLDRLAGVLPPKAPAKYRARKVERDGVKFDSQKEADRFAELQQLERAGQIHDLRRQVPFVLAPAVRLAGEARKKPALRYWADAVYVQAGHVIVEDTKSAATRKLASYRNKKHLMKSVHGIDIKEV